MSVSRTTLIGNVGKDPEIIQIDNGTIAKFSLATSETYHNKQGEKITNTEWHNVVVYNKMAEIVERWIKKGQLLYVLGQNKTSSWDDKEGNKRYSTDVVVRDFSHTIQMLGGKSDNAENNTTNTANNQANSTPNPDDDLPY